MSEIKQLLDQYAEAQAAIDAENIAKQEQIDSILTPELVAQVEAIEVEFGERIKAAQENQAALKEKIRAAVERHGETVKGDHFMAVFSRRTSWDNKALQGYAAAHPELEKFKSESVSVNIRAVG